jgi:hypothetical protein
MEKKAFFRLSVAAVALGAGIFAAAAPVRSADSPLIWSTSSPAANQSTEALAGGRHGQAIRFARDVLRSKTHASNHLIARHNLCLAYIAQGKDADAKPFCDAALAAEARYHVVEKDGRLVVSTASGHDATTPTLETAVRANVARAQGAALAENR